MPDFKDLLLDILLPRACAACQEDLTPPASGPLCGTCLLRLRPYDGPPRRLPGFAVWAAYAYRGPVRELVHAFKYGGRLSVGRALGGWMAGLLPRLSLGPVDAVVPVPLHPARLRERGFNQAAVLAEAVAHAARAPVLDLLERRRRTAAQWRLGKRRRADNLRSAFHARGQEDLRGLQLLLVDDVCTTGRTLCECVRALEDSGAKIGAFVLALD